MLVISLRTVLQEAAATDEQHLSGHIRDPKALFAPENLKELESKHTGPLGFLAFVPDADKAISDYLVDGTLAGDSGPNLLILFVTTKATSAVTLSRNSLGDWLDVETSRHPAYEIIRELFRSKQVPPLPGIAFFPSLLGEQEAVYVGLSGLADAASARARLRTVFSQADRAWVEAAGDLSAFVPRLAATFLRDGAAFARAGRISMREWLIRAYQFVDQHKGDIVSVVSFGLKFVKPGGV